MNQQEEFESHIELKFEALKYLSLDNMDMEDLRILLTYEMWHDGMGLNEAMQFYEELDWPREGIINYLRDVFDYA